MPIMIIYMLLVIAMLIIAKNSYASKKVDVNFTDSKINLGIVNKDSDTELIVGLYEYLQPYVNFIILEEVDIKTAFSYGKIDCMIKIPEGFSRGIYTGEKGTLEKTYVKEKAREIDYVNQLLNGYLDIWLIYEKASQEYSKIEILEQIREDIEEKGRIILTFSEQEINEENKISRYFNRLSYVCLASMMIGIGMPMRTFMKKTIRTRIFQGPISSISFYSQLFIANMCVLIAVWMIGILSAFVLFGSQMLTSFGIFLMISYFIFAISCFSVSFLFCQLFKRKVRFIAVGNIVALGMSFLGGALTSQDSFNEQINLIGSFIPSFWYVKANELAGSLVVINKNNIGQLVYPLCMLMGLTIAILSIALVVLKQTIDT